MPLCSWKREVEDEAFVSTDWNDLCVIANYAV